MSGPLPLEGIRVVEFSHMVMGPTCGLILADLGAEVVKIEPVDGDRTRRLKGFGIGCFSIGRNGHRFDAQKPEAGPGRAEAVGRTVADEFHEAFGGEHVQAVPDRVLAAKPAAVLERLRELVDGVEPSGQRFVEENAEDDIMLAHPLGIEPLTQRSAH